MSNVTTKQVVKEKAKNHHWVPQTYIKEWGNGGASVYEFDKKKLNEGKQRNVENILSLRHLYSKKTGDIYALDEDNVDQMIQESLANLDIVCGEEKLSSWKDYCSYFQQFDEWVIKDNGKDIPRKVRNPLKQKISYWYDVEIEDLLAEKIDDRWMAISSFLAEKIYKSKTITKVETNKKEILEFVLIQYFRTPFEKNILRALKMIFNMFEKAVKGTCIEAELPKMERCHWLKSLEKFLEYKDDGELASYNYIMQSYEILIKGKFTFLISVEGNFITSDNPATMVLDDTWINGLYMPLTPQIMIFIAQNTAQADRNHYNIIDVGLKHVCSLNNIILKNCNQKVYSDKEAIQDIIGEAISKEEWRKYFNQKMQARGVII